MRRAAVAAAAVLLVACGARTDLGGPSGAGGAGASSSERASSSASSTSSSVSSSVSSSSAASSSSSSASSSSASSGAGGAPATGCSDGTREGFVDEGAYPKIAACTGGFTVPGILQATTPHCGRMAGNSSPNIAGVGCGAADLCAEGFHVCRGADEVAQKSPTGCQGAAPAPDLFFATRQGSTGCATCALGTDTDPTTCNGCSCAMDCATNATTANDLFGCGSIGDTPSSCGVLDRFSNDLCGALNPVWQCGDDGCNEANDVTKDAGFGGVLCCADGP
ncbi:MAG TPA: hypothetical protein VHB21_21305 [Minicystis sp.]|nr:hypothetical protein [Minicystis sp.]